MSDVLLKIENLDLSYGGGLVAAELSLSLDAGKTLAIVGESGCGKSTLLKSILGLADSGVVTRGSIVLGGIKLTDMPAKQRRRLLGCDIGMIFQDPGASFNPIRKYKKQFAETLSSHGLAVDEKEILDCFEKLGLPGRERILESCPYEMSGGMNQRIAIAAAMLLKPRLLLLDEPTSALDVTTQKIVVDELMCLRDLTGMTMMIVTHNLGIAAKMAEYTGVMYAGRLVEYGETNEILSKPLHPYTKSLIAAVPTVDGCLPAGIDGQPPLYGAAMQGCGFYERCAEKNDACKEKKYILKEVTSGHFACCGRQCYE